MGILEKAFSTDEYSKEDLMYMAKVFRFISYKTIWNTFESCNNYNMPKNMPEYKGHFQYWYGDKEAKDRAWDFHFDETLHRDGFYYHFTHCPIADFCRKYGYEEITPVLCDIDFITMGMMHSVLHREHTLASGGSLCDYWTAGDRIKNPR